MNFLKVCIRCLTIVLGVTPVVGICYLSLVLFTKLLPVLQVWLTKLIVDSLASNLPNSFLIVVKLTGIYTLSLLINAGIQPVQQFLAAWLENNAVAEIDRRLMHVGFSLVDLSYIESFNFQDELRLSEEAAFYAPRLFVQFEQGIGTLVTLSGFLLLLVQVHPLMPLVLVVSSLPHIFTEQKLNQLKYEIMVDRSNAARQMDYYTRVMTETSSAKEVRAFGLDQFFLKLFQVQANEALIEISKLRIKQMFLSIVFSSVYALTLSGCFWYLVLQVTLGKLTIGDIALYFNIIWQAQSLLLGIPTSLGFFYETYIHLNGLFSLFDGAKPSIILNKNGETSETSTTIQEGVSFRNVSFIYPENNKPVLENLSGAEKS
jgi:ATP-binding cassette, subfamily B, bacterial